MLLAEISLWPMDKGQSVGAYVAKVLDVIDQSGLSYKLGPLGTCIEGDVDDVFRVIRDCHKVLEADCDRVACTIKMDWRRGRTGAIDGKVASVERSLGRQLRK